VQSVHLEIKWVVMQMLFHHYLFNIGPSWTNWASWPPRTSCRLNIHASVCCVSLTVYAKPMCTLIPLPFKFRVKMYSLPLLLFPLGSPWCRRQARSPRWQRSCWPTWTTWTSRTARISWWRCRQYTWLNLLLLWCLQWSRAEMVLLAKMVYPDPKDLL